MASSADRATNSLTLNDVVEGANLDSRYWTVFAILAFAYMLDYFDFFIISFLMAEIGPSWQLTYGEIAAILLSGGVGSIIGALAGGYLGDRYGRRPLLIWSNIICGAMSGAVALLPDGAWILFALLRFIAGVAIGAIAAVALAYVVERTPKRHRTIVVGLAMVAPSAGVALASMVAGLLLDLIGWRGVAATAAAPIVAGVLMWFFLGESVQWLVARGRHDDAKRAAERQIGRAIGPVRIAVTNKVSHDAPSSGELLRFPRQAALALLLGIGTSTGIYGTYLWGPAILSMGQSFDPGKAAQLFVYVSVAGISGKLAFAFLPHYFGRPAMAIIATLIGAFSLAAAAMAPSGLIGPLPIILLCFMGMAFFLEGGLSNIFPYVAELFPTRLAARGAGLVHGGVGAGKIIGPLSLTIIAGSSDVIRPQATQDAVLPAFLFLSACAGIACLALLALREKSSVVDADRLAEAV
jgi:putative MFS transporter